MKRRDFLNSCAAVSTGWAAAAVRPARANQRAFGVNQQIHYSNLTPAGIGRAADGSPPARLDWDFYLGLAPLVPFNPKRFLATYRYFWDYAGDVRTDCVKSRQQPIADLESAHRVATACRGTPSCGRWAFHNPPGRGVEYQKSKLEIRKRGQNHETQG